MIPQIVNNLGLTGQLASGFARCYGFVGDS